MIWFFFVVLLHGLDHKMHSNNVNEYQTCNNNLSIFFIHAHTCSVYFMNKSPIYLTLCSDHHHHQSMITIISKFLAQDNDFPAL